MTATTEQTRLPHETQTADPSAMANHGCGVTRGQASEGSLARSIEEHTAQIPSDTWLWAAGGSIALSLALQASGDKQKALFVSNWAPTLLLLGIYNKMVKQHGSEGD